MADDLIGDFAARHGLSPDIERDLRRLFGFSPTRPEGATLDTLPVLDDGPLPEDISAPPTSVTERYDDIMELGAGGVGEVRRVYDRHLRRNVAMKTLATSDPRATSRFFAEARVGARLQHPNLLPIYDMGVHESGQPWFTMREARGQTFTAAIADVHAASATAWGVGTHGFTLRRLVGGFAAMCRAMAYAHDKHVIHRDLKPENVMVSADGELVILDWGLAFFLSDTAPTAALAGTPAYMPPELAKATRFVASKTTYTHSVPSCTPC